MSTPPIHPGLSEWDAADARFRLVFESSPAGMIIADAQGRMVMVNATAERWFGYERAELLGQPVELLVPERFRARHPEYRARYMAQPTVRPMGGAGAELFARRKDGSVFPVDISLHPIRTAEGMCVLANIVDITERKRIAAEEKRLAAIGQMVTGLAHESRNALQRALACVEMLELDLSDRPALLDLTARARKALGKLHRLYEEVRGYAAPLHLERQPCDLRELWREVWVEILEAHPEYSARLRDENSQSVDRTVHIDRLRIEQVLRNIFENALAVSPDEGSISVRCTETVLDARPALRIAITDDGPGLTSEQRYGIFEPFFTTKTQGTGLGMAIARRIVEAHGGTIAADNAPGRGAEIVVMLPRAKS